MSETALDLLGQIVGREVRDNAIGNFDGYLEGNYRGAYANAVRALYEERQHDPRALLHAFIPVIVDETIGIFLQALDQHIDRVVLEVKEGTDQKSPYEYTDALEAEYRPGDGWIATYSQARHSEV